MLQLFSYGLDWSGSINGCSLHLVNKTGTIPITNGPTVNNVFAFDGIVLLQLSFSILGICLTELSDMTLDCREFTNCSDSFVFWLNAEVKTFWSCNFYRLLHEPGQG